MAGYNKSNTLPNPRTSNLPTIDNQHLKFSKEEGENPSGDQFRSRRRNSELESDTGSISPNSAADIEETDHSLDEYLQDPEIRAERRPSHKEQSISWTPDKTPGAIPKTRPLRWTTGSYSDQFEKENDLFLYYVPVPRCSKIDELIRGLEENKKLKYFDFERDFLPNKSLLNELGVFLHTSKRTVIVLSPFFYASKMHMYVLQTVVSYCVDYEICAIVSLLVDTDPSQMPKGVSLFPYIDTKEDGWFLKLKRQLDLKVGKIESSICTKLSHVSIDEFSTIRSVNSEPATIRRQLSERTKLEMQIWFRFRSGRSKTMPNESIIPKPKESQYQVKERTVDDNVIFACHLRAEGKNVYECSEMHIGESLKLNEGDVLEVLDNTCSGDCKVRNSQGQTGYIPYGLLTPSLFPLPSAAVKLANQPISEANNTEFRQRLEETGLEIYQAVENHSGNIMNLKVKKGDILLKVSNTGNRCKVKNYHNEIGYIDAKLIKKISPPKTIC
ncbi:uncharacterized protein LOC126810343 [Patella vulgata]|uniref:uncharacterized protein LOC126810343 n=1 Tax=Patella vulgata TaxID=6465 RepID=UPI00217F8E25|nr:uncharacterized protein LOC126810343 [Patella vulgata]